MTRIARALIALLLLSLALAGCGENASTAIGSTQNCRSTWDSGTCTGSIRTVRGPYNYRIENDRLKRDTPVWVEVQLSLASGALRVSLSSVDGETVQAIARPGEPVDLAGYSAVGSFESIPVGMHVIEGQEATGVQYTVSWRAD